MVWNWESVFILNANWCSPSLCSLVSDTKLSPSELAGINSSSIAPTRPAHCCSPPQRCEPIHGRWRTSPSAPWPEAHLPFFFPMPGGAPPLLPHARPRTSPYSSPRLASHFPFFFPMTSGASSSRGQAQGRGRLRLRLCLRARGRRSWGRGSLRLRDRSRGRGRGRLRPPPLRSRPVRRASGWDWGRRQ